MGAQQDFQQAMADALVQDIRREGRADSFGNPIMFDPVAKVTAKFSHAFFANLAHIIGCLLEMLMHRGKWRNRYFGIFAVLTPMFTWSVIAVLGSAFGLSTGFWVLGSMLAALSLWRNGQIFFRTWTGRIPVVPSCRYGNPWLNPIPFFRSRLWLTVSIAEPALAFTLGCLLFWPGYYGLAFFFLFSGLAVFVKYASYKKLERAKWIDELDAQWYAEKQKYWAAINQAIVREQRSDGISEVKPDRDDRPSVVR